MPGTKSTASATGRIKVFLWIAGGLAFLFVLFGFFNAPVARMTWNPDPAIPMMEIHGEVRNIFGWPVRHAKVHLDNYSGGEYLTTNDKGRFVTRPGEPYCTGIAVSRFGRAFGELGGVPGHAGSLRFETGGRLEIVIYF